jgi:uncharacterized protein YraI
MPFCSKPLGAVLSVAAIAAVTMVSPGRAQQDPPAAGQETTPQTTTEAKPPEGPAAAVASAPTSLAPPVRAAAAPPSKRPSQFGPAHPGSARSAVVTATVNLRSGPGTDSEVVTTIPAGSTVHVADCGEWCTVTWNGHKGYAIARNLGPGALRQARAYPGQPGYTDDYELEPPVVYGAPGYYAPPAVVYGPAYYGPRVYYGPGWGWRRHWW